MPPPPAHCVPESLPWMARAPFAGCALNQGTFIHRYKHPTRVPARRSRASGPTREAQANRHRSKVLTDPQAGVSACPVTNPPTRLVTN